MTTQKIYWLPTPSPNVVAYEILKSDTGIQGAYTRLKLVLNQTPGPNWDDKKQCFFYEDDEIIYRYYRLRVMDRYGNIAEDSAPLPFMANNTPMAAPRLHVVALTADWGGPGAYKYVTAGGTPVKDAIVRVFKKIDYETNQLTNVVGVSHTDSFGKFDPIFVAPGETYTIVYHKPYEYGPDAAEVTV